MSMGAQVPGEAQDQFGIFFPPTSLLDLPTALGTTPTRRHVRPKAHNPGVVPMTNDIIEEGEMAKVREIFQRAIDAIAAATSLSKTVKDLQAQVDQVSHDLDDLRQRNIALDDLVAGTRKQRDDAIAELNETKANLAQTTRDKNNAVYDLADKTRTIETLRAQLAEAKAQADDYGFKHLDASDKLAAAESKLAKLREAMGIPAEVPKSVEPEAKPEPNRSDWINPNTPIDKPAEADHPAMPWERAG